MNKLNNEAAIAMLSLEYKAKVTLAKALVISCSLLSLSVPTSFANGMVDYKFEPGKRSLTAQVFTCYPGANAKTKLKNLIPKVTAVGLKQNIKAHEAALIEQFGVPSNDINAHLFALQLKVRQANYQHDFNQQGNQTCTNATTTLTDIGTADFIKDLDELIPFKPQTQLFYFGRRDTIDQQIKDLILNNDLPIEPGALAQSTETVFGNGDEHYFTFDLEDYRAILTAQRKTVYLTGNSDSVAAVAAYLSDKGFTLTTEREQAYWHVNTELNIIKADNGLNQIALSLTAQHDDMTTQFVNKPADMPIANVNKASIVKTTAVHLELMSLAESLLTASH